MSFFIFFWFPHEFLYFLPLLDAFLPTRAATVQLAPAASPMVTRVGLWRSPLLGPDPWGSGVGWLGRHMLEHREEMSDFITITRNIVLPGGPGVTLH